MTSLSMGIPVEMLLSVRHALRIGETTSMMCSHPKERAEFRALNDFLDAHIPDALQYFEENDWLLACQRIKAGEALKVEVQAKRKHDFSWGDIEGYYVSILDGEGEDIVNPYRFHIKPLDEETAQRNAEQVKNIFEQLAPMDTATPALK